MRLENRGEELRQKSEDGECSSITYDCEIIPLARCVSLAYVHEVEAPEPFREVDSVAMQVVRRDKNVEALFLTDLEVERSKSEDPEIVLSREPAIWRNLHAMYRTLFAFTERYKGISTAQYLTVSPNDIVFCPLAGPLPRYFKDGKEIDEYKVAILECALNFNLSTLMSLFYEVVTRPTPYEIRNLIEDTIGYISTESPLCMYVRELLNYALNLRSIIFARNTRIEDILHQVKQHVRNYTVFLKQLAETLFSGIPEGLLSGRSAVGLDTITISRASASVTEVGTAIPSTVEIFVIGKASPHQVDFFKDYVILLLTCSQRLTTEDLGKLSEAFWYFARHYGATPQLELKEVISELKRGTDADEVLRRLSSSIEILALLDGFVRVLYRYIVHVFEVYHEHKFSQKLNEYLSRVPGVNWERLVYSLTLTSLLRLVGVFVVLMKPLVLLPVSADFFAMLRSHIENFVKMFRSDLVEHNLTKYVLETLNEIEAKYRAYPEIERFVNKLFTGQLLEDESAKTAEEIERELNAIHEHIKLQLEKFVVEIARKLLEHIVQDVVREVEESRKIAKEVNLESEFDKALEALCSDTCNMLNELVDRFSKTLQSVDFGLCVSLMATPRVLTTPLVLACEKDVTLDPRCPLCDVILKLAHYLADELSRIYAELSAYCDEVSSSIPDRNLAEVISRLFNVVKVIATRLSQARLEYAGTRVYHDVCQGLRERRGPRRTCAIASYIL